MVLEFSFKEGFFFSFSLEKGMGFLGSLLLHLLNVCL